MRIKRSFIKAPLTAEGFKIKLVLEPTGREDLVMEWTTGPPFKRKAILELGWVEASQLYTALGKQLERMKEDR